MSGKALVLGGGGAVGIAWEVGVLHGLREAGLDLANADRIIGTSAGSVVGAQIALGLTTDVLLAEQLGPSDPATAQAMVFDPQTFMTIAGHWATMTEMNAANRAAIGALALAARTVDEATWLNVFAGRLNGFPWPQHLIVTGVDAESGAFVAWDQRSGVPLSTAVAASCTVPGIFPPVTINGRRYIDGGVRSGTNADLAQGCARVIIIAPLGSQTEGSGPGAKRQIEGEIAGLRAAGSAVDVLLPDTDALAAFGPNLMDAGRRASAAETGVRQGRAAAQQLAAVWNAA